MENDIEILGEFIDENRQKDYQTKPQLNLAISALHRYKAGLFISYEFQDWIVDEGMYGALIDKIIGSGRAIVSIAEGFDTSTAEGKSQALILRAFLHYWKVIGNKPADGHRYTNADIIDEIVEYYSIGWSPKEIARILNDRGVKRHNGQPWCTNNISWILARSVSDYEKQNSFKAFHVNKKIALTELT